MKGVLRKISFPFNPVCESTKTVSLYPDAANGYFQYRLNYFMSQIVVVNAS